MGILLPGMSDAFTAITLREEPRIRYVEPPKAFALPKSRYQLCFFFLHFFAAAAARFFFLHFFFVGAVGVVEVGVVGLAGGAIPVPLSVTSGPVAVSREPAKAPALGGVKVTALVHGVVLGKVIVSRVPVHVLVPSAKPVPLTVTAPKLWMPPGGVPQRVGTT
jgi:hypothetical protein